MNKYVTNNGSTVTIGRVVGDIGSNSSSANTYARSAGMIVAYNWNGSTGTNKTIDQGMEKPDGADTSTYNTSGFYTSTPYWLDYIAWDLTNVWQWGGNLPILRNMPTGPQTHTVKP